MVKTTTNVTPLDYDKWSVTDEILESLNDYLIDVWCDSKIKKKVNTGLFLLGEAIKYTEKNKPKLNKELIKTTAEYLAKTNKLIGIAPEDVD